MITRCPSCRTAFKVVPDQLRIAAGWVRCGHCGELFDGQAHLVHPAAAIGEPAMGQAPSASQPEGALAGPTPENWADPPDLAIDPGTADAEADFRPTTLVQPQDRLASGSNEAEPAVAELEEALPAEHEPIVGIPAEPWLGAPPFPAPEVEASAPAGSLPFPERLGEPRFDTADTEALDPFELPAAPISLDPDPRPAPGTTVPDPYPFAAPRVAPPQHSAPHAPEVPSFVRRAQPHPFWDRGNVRALLWVTLVLLIVALASQWLYQERDWLAARFPPLRNAIVALCEPLGCSVQPYRMLDAIAIDGSDFKAVDERTFRLDLSVRNNADLEVATPSFQLTLANLQGQVLVRRVVDPAELGAPATLKAHGQFDATRALRISSAAQPDSITSYRVVAFYP